MPDLYWTVVVLVSIVGTLISDNLVDNFGGSLVATTLIFAAARVLVFARWYASEKTLSVHSIDIVGLVFYLARQQKGEDLMVVPQGRQRSLSGCPNKKTGPTAFQGNQSGFLWPKSYGSEGPTF